MKLPYIQPTILWAVACASLASIAFAQSQKHPAKELPGWTADLAMAKKAAAKGHSIYLVDFNASWCGPCQKYKSEIFPTKEFHDATKGMILVDVDVDAEKNTKTVEQLKIDAIPDLRIYSPKGVMLGRFVGYDKQELFDLIKRAKAKAAKG